MGERNKVTQAIILNVKKSGENNQTVTALTNDSGIQYFTFYGGPKNHLRSYIQTLNYGTLYFYEDNIKHFKKISDFDVKKSHLTIRNDLYKMCAATFTCEVILKTHCAGEYKNAFTLLCSFLTGLESSTEKECKIALIRFLWRYLILSGTEPNTFNCLHCENKTETLSEPFYFISSQNAFVCSDCIKNLAEKSNSKFLYTLSKESLMYLSSISSLSPSQVRTIKISADSYNELKQFLFYVIENNCEGKLVSLESGETIL